MSFANSIARTSGKMLGRGYKVIARRKRFGKVSREAVKIAR